MKEFMVGHRGKELAGPMKVSLALDKLHAMMRNHPPHYQLKVKGGVWSRVRDFAGTAERLKELADSVSVGTTILVRCTKDQAVLVLRAVELIVPVNTEGTPPIDLIWPAVREEFDAKYGIVNLGICASKEGEHHECNAWDIGVAKPKAADDIHSAILDIANWLKAQGQKHIDTGGKEGLPVGGIIVMSQWCERSGSRMTGWAPYSGIPHVSHVHLSAWPGLVVGWI